MEGLASELNSGSFKIYDRSQNKREDSCIPLAFPMATGPDVASRVVVTGPKRRIDDGGHGRWLNNEKIAYAYELLNELGLTADDMRLLVPKTQNTGTAAASAAHLDSTTGRVHAISYGHSITGDPYIGSGDAVGLSQHADTTSLATIGHGHGHAHAHLQSHPYPYHPHPHAHPHLRHYF